MNQELRKAGKSGEPNDRELDAALYRGLADVRAGRVVPIEEVKKMIPEWILKSSTDFRA